MLLRHFSFRKIASALVAAVSLAALLPVTPAEATTSYRLTVIKTGPGTVTSLPGGINCGTTCSATYASGTDVTLVATPTPGNAFAGWSGDCSGTGGCIVSMTSPISVSATFVTLRHTLEVFKAGSGVGTVSSRPSGISCGSSCVRDYNGGTSLTLTASPAPGSVFTGWSGACTNTTGTCMVSMTDSRSVTATFKTRPKLTVARSGSGTGTVTSGPAGISCGRTCSRAFTDGTSVTLTATAASGSRFAGWSGACTNLSGSCTTTVDSTKNVTARFDRVFSLSVSKAGNGTGTVTSSPAGITCGPSCTSASTASLTGQTVTLTATPTTNHTFSGWSGACSGTGACTVTVDAARSVTATFTRVPYALTVTKAGDGSGSVVSSPSGITCGSTCSASLLSGAAVTLTATPASGSAFDGWSGEGCTGTSTCTLTMTSARNVIATFKPGFVLAVSKTGAGTGTVTSSPSGVVCGSTCSYTFVTGTSVTLTATPAAESTFVGWSGAGCSGTSTCTVSMSEARNVTANFAKVQYTLTVSKAGDGSGSVSSSVVGISCGATCDAGFDSGTNVVLTATPSAANAFTGWSGACTNSSGTCTVSMTTVKSVTATFEPTFVLTVTKAGDGATSGTVTSNVGGVNCGSGAGCSASIVEDTVVTLTATSASGSGVKFTGWSGDCTGTASTCSVTMAAAKSVTATFEKVYQTLAVTLSGSGSGLVTSNPAGISCQADCSESYLSERTIVLTATPSPDSVFTGWSGGGCSGSALTCTVTMDGPTAPSVSSNKAVTATFAPYFVLTVTKSGSGSVTSSPAGINCGSTCSGSFGSGSTVTLTAYPSGGYVLQNWGGACSGSSTTCNVTMSEAKNVSATFVATVTLSISKVGSTGTGVVTSSPAGINCGTVCFRNIGVGTETTLTATPSTGSKFDGWSGADCAEGTQKGSTCTVNIASSQSVNAVFLLN